MQKNQILAAAAVAAAFTLGACNTEPETIAINDYDPMAEALENAGPVELPPAIANSRTYRCSDNSLFYVDFYTNNTARLRTVRGGDSVELRAEGGNPPYIAPGHSVSGSGESVRISAPGKGNLSCHT